MKVKNLIIIFFTIAISQFLSATKFEIINMTSHRFIDVDPIWKGNPRGWARISKENYLKRFDSGVHHLQTVRWMLPSGWCWMANVEDVLDGALNRFRHNVLIKIYDNGIYTIDLKGGLGESQPRQASRGNC